MVTMKCVSALLLLGALTILLHPAASRSKEFEEFVAKAQSKCKKLAGMSDDGDRRDPPLTDDGKCCPFCACWVNEIGYMTNGKWNLTTAEMINSQKWDDPQKASLNNKIDGICFKEVSTEGKRECESALQYRDCKHKLAKQVTILGINSLFGKVVSFLLKQSPIANRLVLYDEFDIQVAHDIAEIPTPCKVVVYNGEEQLRCAVRNSDVILIGDKDDCLAGDEEAIHRKAADIVRYANAISSIAPNAIVLIAATPVNSLLPLFTEAQISCGTFDSDRVMGVTSADTMRASTLLARHMGIEPEKAYLPVIGGSSADTRIPLFSQSRPTINASKNDLKNLTRVVKMTEEELKTMLNRGEALNKAYATVQLIDSVMSALRGQRNISEIVLSRTCLVPNVDYFSLPVILGPRGIAHRFPLPSLTERESILLDHAVKHIEIDKMKGINALNGECTIPQAPEMTEKYNELINVCQKDFVGSLMERFKIGADCPEVCAPRVEYKLLSKVKLKLPPESKPSEMPKRTKFIEPDTPPQDGCCPLKLPCPPIPPIRGLNQIQVKHTCKSRDKPKSCKCFFPPVEKSLVPCKLCPSNKPCVDYEDFKTFYEEHRHCCGPISSPGEFSPGSDIGMISASTTIFNSNVPHHNSSVQLASSNETTPATANGSDTKVLTIAPAKTMNASVDQPKKTIFHAVWEYPKVDVPSTPLPNPTSAVEQQAAQEATPNATQYSAPTDTHTHQAAPTESNKTKANQINPQNSNQLRDPTTQHDDQNWPFKCSTTLCLDVLAPKTPGYQPANTKSVVPGDHISKPSDSQKQTELENLTHTSIKLQSSQSAQPMIHNMDSDNQGKQHKRYNYSSGLSLANPKNAIEEIRPLMNPRPNPNRSDSSPQEDSTHTTAKHQQQSSNSIQNCCQPDSCSFPDVERTDKIESTSTNLKECYNRIAALSTQKLPGLDSGETSPGAIDVKRNSVIIKRSGISEEIKDQRRLTDNKNLDERRARDENVKRRIYATLKVIEDIKSFAPKPSTSTASNTFGLSSTQYFNNDSRSSRVFKPQEPEVSSENAMLSILRDRAKTINANMVLQKELRASLELSRRKRRKENLGLGDLIDTINPAKRLPKRLESRPALRKAYRGLQKMYGDSRHLGNQGKSASILVTPKPGHEEKSLVIVENPKEPKRVSSRIERIKERIQEALKKIIYPVDTSSEIKSAEKMSKHRQKLSHKLVTRPVMRKNSEAKQDFFVEMRKMDPAYRPTTRMYAPKCPTRLLYDDHPKNHSKIITFNNVTENETTIGTSVRSDKAESLPDNTSIPKDIKRGNRSYVFPDVPDFPELNLKHMESKNMVKEFGEIGAVYFQGNSVPRGVEPTRLPKDDRSGVYSVNQSPREPGFSGPVRIQGDYVKHFETQSLPKSAVLPESVRAAIREQSRKVVTPRGIRAQVRNDMRYGMTSPNRMTYPRKRN